MRLNLTERLPACIRGIRTRPHRQLFRHSRNSYIISSQESALQQRRHASERGCRRRWNGSALRAREGEFRCSLGFGCRPPP